VLNYGSQVDIFVGAGALKYLYSLNDNFEVVVHNEIAEHLLNFNEIRLYSILLVPIQTGDSRDTN
jgi:hypothetical protein